MYTRLTCLPLIALAIWSRDWLGWGALFPLAIALFWTWYNPRAFTPYDKADNWATKGVLGERIFLGRHKTPVPESYLHNAWISSLLSFGGLVVLGYGLWHLSLVYVLLGLTGVIIPKLWFVSKMGRLYDEAAHPRG